MALSGLVRLVREPLVHFLILGGVLAGVRGGLEVGDERMVRVTRAAREHLVKELQGELGREPTEAERAAALARWKVDEVAYREAVRLGLDRTDPELRARLAARALEVFRGLEVVREPTDTELTGFLEEHRARYELPERLTIEHAFAARERGNAEERARAFVAAMKGGKELAALGDVFDVGSKVEDAAFEDLARLFGFEFATGVSKADTGDAMVLESTRGVHAVRVVKRTAAGLPPEDELRRRLVRDWKASQGSALKERAKQRLLEGYRFVEES